MRNFAHMKHIALLILMTVSAALSAQQTNDSVRITTMLAKGRKVAKAERFLHYANEFIGTPYVAHTLDTSDISRERLVVHLDYLDCTTFIDIAAALTLATEEGTYASFTKHMKRIRYHNGVIDGYASRNHYFAETVDNGRKLGFLTVIDEGDAEQTLAINYMTTHRNKYLGIAKDNKEYGRIKAHELELTGKKIRYFTQEALRKSDKGLDNGYLKKHIKTGYIIGIITTKKGLDTSHLGIAVWGKDGKLHLLNASRLHGKVVLETKTLYEYMTTQNTQCGIRVVRLNN